MTKPGKLKKLSNYRVLTCLACKYYDADKDECLICGCPVEVKASWSTEVCPKNKWNK